MRAAALLLIPGFLFADDVYQAPSPEPTAEETLILELMNRFRANPKAESEYIVKTFGHGDKIFGAQAKMFLDECATLKSMPPVMFNLQLLNAARKHAYYMVHNGLGHTEEAGKRGFTESVPATAPKPQDTQVAPPRMLSLVPAGHSTATHDSSLMMAPPLIRAACNQVEAIA
jgi:hypothetical protein